MPKEALARIPSELSAAPFVCAGITTFKALRNSDARRSDLVAIQGIGGLGHLGIQFASKFGFDTVAMGRRADKKSLALKLGARADWSLSARVRPFAVSIERDHCTAQAETASHLESVERLGSRLRSTCDHPAYFRACRFVPLAGHSRTARDLYTSGNVFESSLLPTRNYLMGG